jgi:hypothetical protein
VSRVPALLALVCGVFALQSLPTAAAAKGGATGTVVTAPVEATPQSIRRAERAAAKAEVVPPPPAPAAAVEAPPPPAGAHARHEERRQQRQEARAQSTAAATSGAAAATKGEANVGDAEALAQRQKKGSGGSGKKERKEKAKEKTKEKTKGKTKGKETEAGGGSPGEEAGDPTEAGSENASLKGKTASVGDSAPVAQASVAAATVAAPVAATLPAVGTGSASITSVAPASNVASGGGPGRGRHRRARAGAAATGAAVQTPAATTSQPLVAPSGGTQASAPHKAAKRSHHSSSQPALVKTFTKIVGVVPTPIRILIVALIGLALLLGARSLFSGVRTRRLVRQRGQLLEDVGVLQAALLPVPPSRLGPVETSVAYRPADGPGAGGDFYDVFALEDGQLAVIVGDVSGHGREALPHTALVRFTVRAYLEAGLSPRKALQTAGSVLERQLGGSFATVLAATYHPRERRLTFASAGHPPPVVLAEPALALASADGADEAPGRDDVAPVTACSAPPVGAGMRTGTRQTTISIPGPTRLCFHTDGVTEARIEGELFGPERLADALSTLAPEADASALLDRVAEQSDARPDDMAACLLRVLDGEGAPSIALEQLELDREAVTSPRVERFLGECGVSRKAAEAILREARARLQREQTVLLELSPGADGPTVALAESNVIHTAAFAIAGAS